MLKQTTLMRTTPHYTNNKTRNSPQQRPAQAAASQPRQLAPAPLSRGAYGLTFKASGPKGPSPEAIAAEVKTLLADGKIDEANEALKRVSEDVIATSPLLRSLTITAGQQSSDPDLRRLASCLIELKNIRKKSKGQ